MSTYFLKIISARPVPLHLVEPVENKNRQISSDNEERSQYHNLLKSGRDRSWAASRQPGEKTCDRQRLTVSVIRQLEEVQ